MVQPVVQLVVAQHSTVSFIVLKANLSIGLGTRAQYGLISLHSAVWVWVWAWAWPLQLRSEPLLRAERDFGLEPWLRAERDFSLGLGFRSLDLNHGCAQSATLALALAFAALIGTMVARRARLWLCHLFIARSAG